MKVILISTILNIYLFGDLLQTFDRFYMDFIGSNSSCLIETQEKNSLNDFSSISEEAIEKLEEIEREEVESSWIPFVDSKESLREDFNQILDDLILSLTGDSRALICLKEMRSKYREILSEKEKIRDIREKSISSISEEQKNKVKEIVKNIEKLKREIEKIREVILKELNSLGMNLSQEELKTLLVRVDSDDILEMMAIFDIAKKITLQLQKLMEESRDDIELSKRYYGMNLVLSETALYIQERYIHSINLKYIPRLKEIISKVKTLSKETIALKNSSKTDYEKKIYSSNLESQNLTLKTAKLYIENLNRQKEQVEVAKKRSIDNLNITRNSYKTLKIGVNLLDLIKETQESFKKVMTIQFPEILPFQNGDVEREYRKLTEEIQK